MTARDERDAGQTGVGAVSSTPCLHWKFCDKPCDEFGNAFLYEVCFGSVHSACITDPEHVTADVCGPVCHAAEIAHEKAAVAPANDDKNGE